MKIRQKAKQRWSSSSSGINHDFIITKSVELYLLSTKMMLKKNTELGAIEVADRASVITNEFYDEFTIG